MDEPQKSAVSALVDGTLAYRNFIAVTEDPNTMEMIGHRVSEGETLKEIADSFGVRYRKLFQWIASDPGRMGEYEGALELYGHTCAMETMAIADGSSEAKLMIDTRFRLAEQLNPDRHGKKVQVDVVHIDLLGVVNQIAERERLATQESARILEGDAREVSN
jgi:hypothetical protein